jgi:hypothetical protein
MQQQDPTLLLAKPAGVMSAASTASSVAATAAGVHPCATSRATAAYVTAHQGHSEPPLQPILEHDLSAGWMLKQTRIRRADSARRNTALLRVL